MIGFLSSRICIVWVSGPQPQPRAGLQPPAPAQPTPDHGWGPRAWGLPAPSRQPEGNKGLWRALWQRNPEAFIADLHSFIWARPSRGAFYYPGLLNKKFLIMRRQELGAPAAAALSAACSARRPRAALARGGSYLWLRLAGPAARCPGSRIMNKRR